MAEVSEEVRNLAARYQEFQRQAEALRQQMNMVQASITSCDQTMVTINELKTASVEGKITETMVPIGFVVHAEIKMQIETCRPWIRLQCRKRQMKPLRLPTAEKQLMKILQQMNASLIHYVRVCKL